MKIDQSFPSHPEPQIQQALDALFRTLQGLKVGRDDVDLDAVGQGIANKLNRPSMWPAVKRLMEAQDSFNNLKVEPSKPVATNVHLDGGGATISSGAFSTGGLAGLLTLTQETSGATGGNCLRIDNAGDGHSIVDVNNGGHFSSGGKWIDSSHSSLKTDWTSLDPDLNLARLRKLPIQEWRYKAEESTRHVGPTAENFHALFGLGDDRSISAADLASLAILGVQSLTDNLRSLHGVVKDMANHLGVLRDTLAQVHAEVEVMKDMFEGGEEEELDAD